MPPSFKKLKLSYEYHKIDLAEIKVEFEKRKKNFTKAYKEFHNNLPPSMQEVVDKQLGDLNRSQPPASPTPPASAPAISSETRQLFKEIAKHVHPDKHVLRDSPYQKEMAILFKRAQQFAVDGNWLELHVIAEDLGLELPDPAEDKLQNIHNKINSMCEEVETVKTTVAWRWGELQHTEEKTIAMQQYYTHLFGIT
jgi:hypothetical protein|tara:strand:+ start:756 stop:1343 length:588 start_codon:yes stop_codon:yes gene_type:complete